MFMGAGFSGALGSLRSRLWVGTASAADEKKVLSTSAAPAVEQELLSIKGELAVPHQVVKTSAGEGGRQ